MPPSELADRDDEHKREALYILLRLQTQAWPLSRLNVISVHVLDTSDSFLHAGEFWCTPLRKVSVGR